MLLFKESAWGPSMLCVGFSYLSWVLIASLSLKVGVDQIGGDIAYTLFFILFPFVMRSRRILALHQARKAMRPIQARYDEVWPRVVQDENATLVDLAEIVARHEMVQV